ncbi:hypothetical protein ABRY23_04625 [Melioribacteraceae bacterium 4301-Me]|uniref:hypothetical protein n=1 Tax=Pyranulibacter aquaticus TaxID=3163344 RepID=UPI003596A789
MNDAVLLTSINKKERFIETWQLYILITLLTLLISIAFQKFILTREVYYNLYSSQIEEYRIDDLIKLIEKMQFWGYLATPLFIWLRLAFVSFLIQLPFLIRYIEIPFNEIFRITTFAFLALLAADAVRFFYLLFLPRDQYTAEVLTMIPLSITNLLNKNNYSDTAYLFLERINIFELIWGYIIYRGLYRTGKINKIDSLLVVMEVWAGIIVLTIAFNILLKTL